MDVLVAVGSVRVCVFVMVVCALFAFESSKTTSTDKQPRGMHGAHILIRGVNLRDYA